jgi:hypothetical protein
VNPLLFGLGCRGYKRPSPLLFSPSGLNSYIITTSIIQKLKTPCHSSKCPRFIDGDPPFLAQLGEILPLLLCTPLTCNSCARTYPYYIQKLKSLAFIKVSSFHSWWPHHSLGKATHNMKHSSKSSWLLWLTSCISLPTHIVQKVWLPSNHRSGSVL